jgi:hypothetical protein
MISTKTINRIKLIWSNDSQLLSANKTLLY